MEEQEEDEGGIGIVLTALGFDIQEAIPRQRRPTIPILKALLTDGMETRHWVKWGFKAVAAGD